MTIVFFQPKLKTGCRNNQSNETHRCNLQVYILFQRSKTIDTCTVVNYVCKSSIELIPSLFLIFLPRTSRVHLEGLVLSLSSKQAQTNKGLDYEFWLINE